MKQILKTLLDASPIEELMADLLGKCLKPDVAVEREFEVKTICGKFRVDFAIRSNWETIGIECDGKAYHAGIDRFRRDICRDALILATARVNVIYRIPGSIIVSKKHECLTDIAKSHPHLFKPLFLKIVDPEFDFIPVAIPPDARVGFWRFGVPPFGRRFYEFAVSKGGGNLDELLISYRLMMRTEYLAESSLAKVES